MKHLICTFLSISFLTACGGGSSSSSSSDTTGLTTTDTETEAVETTTEASELDEELFDIIERQGLTGDPSSNFNVPDIESPLAQLGMKLFFTKSLGGDMDSACASCHHPMLGGTDNLSLSIGVDAISPDLLGPGRENNSGDFPVPRNAPTTLNSMFYENGLFWDSRVEQLAGGIRTPDTDFGEVDSNAGDSLLSAQSRFPVTSGDEMKGFTFEEGTGNDHVRAHLAARIGGYDGGYSAASELSTNEWLLEFQTAFGSTEDAEDLITYENIAAAIAEYEASQVFIDSPWKAYIEGDLDAISDDAKEGAILFYTRGGDGGADCSRCHEGDFFTDEEHHVVAFPQFGLGKGDGTTGSDDFGRERETGDEDDRYHFRTPTLLNIAVTAPYTHTGAYETLEQVVSHYDRPQDGIDFFDGDDWCHQMEQFEDIADCDSAFPDALTNTQNANDLLDDIDGGQGGGGASNVSSGISNINLDNDEINQIVAFLETLTDPCVTDRDCMSPWIPEEGDALDENQLNAVDENGDTL